MQGSSLIFTYSKSWHKISTYKTLKKEKSPKKIIIELQCLKTITRILKYHFFDGFFLESFCGHPPL